MMTGRAEQWRQLALAVMLDGRWTGAVLGWRQARVAPQPVLCRRQRRGCSDAKYSTLNATSSSLTNVIQREALGWLID